MTRLPEPGAAEPHVRLRELSKRFGGVEALREVSVDIATGEVHALVGENGAGKSTLGKVVAGIHRPDEGELQVNGRSVQFADARQALALGITTIAQELPLVPGMTVIDNVFLGANPAIATIVARREQARRFDELSERAGFDLRSSARVGDLRIADQQKVAILGALAREARLIVMDEPTAALPRGDADHLLKIVRALATAGTTIIYVSHFLEEVLSVADTVTVMKDGRVVRTRPAHQETPELLMSGMLGRDQSQQYPEGHLVDQTRAPSLRVESLTRRGAFHDVSFEVRPGEIVGLAGLVGSGRSEVARAVCGADRFDSGRVLLCDRELKARHPARAIERGMVLIPDNRKELGLVMGQSVGANLALPNLKLFSRFGFLDARRMKASIVKAIEAVGMKATPRQPVATLSGGNQQKVLFGRWIQREPTVLVADEPTRGVDVGAKRGIYDLLVDLAQSGMSVVLISNENEELIGMCQRILVMRRGTIVAELTGERLVENEILSAALGNAPVGAGQGAAG